MSRITPRDDVGTGEQDLQVMFGEVPKEVIHEESVSRSRAYERTVSITMKALNLPKRDTLKSFQGQLKPWFIISHENTWKCLYNYLMSLMLMESNIISLYWLAFGEPQGSSLAYDTLMQAFFLIDFVLNFLTTYVSKKDEIVVSPTLIALKYCNRWMIFDLIALIPFRVVGLPSLEFFLRLSRCGKFNRIFVITRSIEIVIVEIIQILYPSKHFIKVATSAMMKMLKVLLVMCFIIYFLACVFLRFTEYEPDNFRNAYLSNYSNSKSLLWTAYFISTTIISVGYGDLLPRNSSERIAVIFIIIIGTVYYAVLAGGFNNVVATLNSLAPNEDNLFDLNSWLIKLEKRFKPLSPELRKSILTHFKYYWANDRLHSIAKEYWNAKNYNDLLQDHCMYFGRLTPELKKNILDSIFHDTFLKFSDFFGDTPLKYELSYHFQPRMYEEGEVIIGEGDQVHEMLFIMKGKVVAEWTAEQERYTFDVRIGVLILGDYEIIEEKPCFVTYKAARHETSIPVEALALPKRAFKMIIQNGFAEEEMRLRAKCGSKHTQIVKYLMNAKQLEPATNMNGSSPDAKLLPSTRNKRRNNIPLVLLCTNLNIAPLKPTCRYSRKPTITCLKS